MKTLYFSPVLRGIWRSFHVVGTKSINCISKSGVWRGIYHNGPIVQQHDNAYGS